MMKHGYVDFLLVDVSNSFTKLAFASRARVGRAMRISTAELSTRRLDRILRKGGARTIVVCSVVPKRNRKIEQAAGNRRIIWLTPKVRLNRSEERRVGKECTCQGDWRGQQVEE